MSPKERELIVILSVLNFTHIVDFMIMMPLSTHLMPLFGITPGQFSLLVSAYTLAAGVCGFVAAFFVNRHDRKRVLLVTSAGFLLGTLACGLAPTYGTLLIARAMAGFFGGLIGSQVMSIVADVFPYERRAQAMGLLTASFSAAAVAGVPFGLFLADHLSWHWPFFFVAAVVAVAWWLVWWRLPAMAGHLADPAGSRPLDALTHILRDRNQQRALWFMSVLVVGHFAIIPFLAPHMEFNVGLKTADVTWIYFAGGLATLFSAPWIGRLADRHGKRAVFTALVLLATVPVLLITHLPPVPFAAAIVCTTLFFILASGRMIPAQALMSSVVPPSQRGSFLSLNASLNQLALAGSSALAGLLVTRGADGRLDHYPRVGWAGVVLSLAALALAWRLTPHASETTKPLAETPLTVMGD